MAAASTTTLAAEHKWERLPSIVTPVAYDLHLTPDLDKFTFAGVVSISLNISASTKKIQLNGNDIKLITTNVTQNGKEIGIDSFLLDEKEEVITITLKEELSIGNALLKIDYTGNLNDQMKGFYRSNYKNAAGESKIMGCTQFEATDARRALPCFDEPALKSTFSVTMNAPDHMIALSNMPCIESKKLGNGYTEHKFDKTPIMSTYLLAFVVGEFDVIETKTNRGVIVRCFTPPGKAKLGEFALDVGRRALELYEKYFEIEYPLPKLDQVAIPDFSAGAMENWGLVTYRETALLVDHLNSSANTLQWVALVVCHELAHQWFGNLVTMEWWTHLWLNEGFATWIERYCTDKLFPDWKIWDQYVSTDLNSTFSMDSLASTHPIEVDVNHPDEVDEIFDIISYSKGSAVIRMLEQYLGAEPFRKGMVEYLKQYKWKNAKTEDLWRVLAESSGKPVSEMMNAWTKQEGFPVVTINDIQTENKKMTLHCTQCRFLQSGPDKSSPLLWHVPASFVVAGHNGAVSTQMLNDREGKLAVDLVEGHENGFVKLNPNQSSLFRVIYPKSLADRLRESLVNGDAYKYMTPSDRLGIQNDAFSLARAGLLPTAQVLDLWHSYQNEKEYTCWTDIINNLSELGSVLKNATDDTPTLYYSYARSLFDQVINYVGWEKKSDHEDHTLSLLRAKVILAAGLYGHQGTIEEATKKFSQYLSVIDQPERASALLPADLRSAVYGMAVVNGGLLGYNAIMHIYEKSDLNEEKVRCLHALARSRDPVLLQRLLDFAFTSVRSQDAPSLLITVANNRFGTELAWNHIKKHWKECIHKWGGSFGLARVVTVPQTFASEEKAAEVEQFFKENEHPAGERAVKQTIEQIRSNASWLKREGKNLNEFLKAHLAKH